MKQTFATHSHTASVRCVSIAGKFLASGGTDDKVVIIDLNTRKEHTVLMNHDGTVNSVAFTHSGTHLLTGSDDGCIIITRTGNWQIEKMWKKAHNGKDYVFFFSSTQYYACLAAFSVEYWIVCLVVP